MAFRFSLSALSWWQCSISKLFSLGWPIVARKYVFSRREAEKLRSFVADGTNNKYFVKLQTQEVFPRCVTFSNFQVMPLLCPRA